MRSSRSCTATTPAAPTSETLGARMLARARREYAAAAAWWRLNRHAAPNKLQNEMLAARKLLAKFPEAGEVDEGQGGEARRILLRESSYFVFYRVNHAAHRIEILAV